jgi:hypothetical protein
MLDSTEIYIEKFMKKLYNLNSSLLKSEDFHMSYTNNIKQLKQIKALNIKNSSSNSGIIPSSYDIHYELLHNKTFLLDKSMVSAFAKSFKPLKVLIFNSYDKAMWFNSIDPQELTTGNIKDQTSDSIKVINIKAYSTSMIIAILESFVLNNNHNDIDIMIFNAGMLNNVNLQQILCLFRRSIIINAGAIYLQKDKFTRSKFKYFKYK